MKLSSQSRPLQSFLLALISAALIFLPFVVYDKGFFIYYGDFNVQQIPFYQLAHEAVRGGDLFWNWYTDLGANFIGSYSFYLLFSPFFWLTLPFPNAWLPFMMAPLLILKTACAALTACMYLRRFVRDGRYAVLGALLYAFSGWMDFNIFFNHFHEVAVFFPLLLLGLEALVQDNRKGLFLAAVALNAAVNYWFFIGEAVFTVLYVLVRRTDKTWPLTFRKFLSVAVESVMGVGLAAVALLPSVMALMGNWRTGTDQLLTGWDLWLYWTNQRQPAIIQSLFFPPEHPARLNFFPDHNAKWASISGWLPLTAMTGVLAYFFQRKNDWLKKILALSLVCALVPVLNSLFILLNDSYYARWFYMPILLMCLATARALEDSAGDTTHFARGCMWSFFALLAFSAIGGLTPRIEEEQLQFGLANDTSYMWIFSAIAMTCLLITAVLVLHCRWRRFFLTAVTAAVLVASVGFNIFYIANGKNDRERSQWLIDHGINARGQIELPEEPFARADVYDGLDNIAMYWRLPTIQTFHSIVPPSIMDFYPAVGVKRDVGSRPEANYYALRPLLSVRWLFIEQIKEDQSPMPGYTFYDNQNSFNIYENDHYLPMGFTYTLCATPEELEEVSTDHRARFMLRAVILEEDVIRRNSDLLTRATDEDFLNLTLEGLYRQDVEDRRAHTADSFEINSRGFTASTSFEEPCFLFFSVPWERGWSAEIQTSGGEWIPLRIEKANIGFMAVRAPEGPAVIRFSYFTPGLIEGAVISGAFLIIAAVYLVISRRFSRTKPQENPPDLTAALLSGQPVQLSWDQFTSLYGDRKARAAKLRQAFLEAEEKRLADTLSDEERTLRFEPFSVGGADNQDNFGDNDTVPKSK